MHKSSKLENERGGGLAPTTQILQQQIKAVRLHRYCTDQKLTVSFVINALGRGRRAIFSASTKCSAKPIHRASNPSKRDRIGGPLFLLLSPLSREMSASLLRNLLLRQKRGGGGRTALEAAACRFGFQAATASAGGFFLFSLAQSPPLLIKCEPQASHSSPAAPAGGASGDKKGPMTMEQIKIALKEALGPIRNSYKHGSPPKVALRDSEGVFSATFPCFSWASSVKVIAAITKILAKHDNTILEVHSTSESLNMLSFVSRDGKGSLVYDGRSPDPKVTIFRDGGFSQTEIDAVTAGYKASLSSGSGIIQLQPPGSKLPSPASLGGSASGNGMQKLESMGVRVYDRTSDEPLEWDSLAGYDKVKREIEDTVVMPLQHPGLFDNIAQKTRARYESNRPRAVLLEGPPGTGKTLTARIIAQRCDMPMIHLGVDTVLSKWYGESERNIKQIWDACDSMGGAIIFVDGSSLDVLLIECFNFLPTDEITFPPLSTRGGCTSWFPRYRNYA
jgi:hypothetical protein